MDYLEQLSRTYYLAQLPYLELQTKNSAVQSETGLGFFFLPANKHANPLTQDNTPSPQPPALNPPVAPGIRT